LGNNTGRNNTATGLEALFSNNGSNNTATGTFALFDNTTGFNNTATGFSALLSAGSGNNNTADGQNALRGTVSGITGSNNTAAGVNALQNDTSGNGNTGTGVAALESNSTGGFNTATGFSALFSNTTGSNNTAAGLNALQNNTTGSNNIALGQSAGANLTTGNGNIDIGNAGVAGEAKTVRIGTTGTQTNAFIVGISGATVPTGVTVIVDSSGHLGTITSSVRHKEAIKPMDKASEAILALQPVTFRYKKDLDPASIPQFGLVAEQVEKVDPDLVTRDDQGKPYTVRYEAVNVMLLNEFLKEHRKVEEQEATIAQQRKDFEVALAQQQKQIEELTADLQKVSAQLELSKTAPQTVLNNQ